MVCNAMHAPGCITLATFTQNTLRMNNIPWIAQVNTVEATCVPHSPTTAECGVNNSSTCLRGSHMYRTRSLSHEVVSSCRRQVRPATICFSSNGPASVVACATMYPTPVATRRYHRPATSACTMLGLCKFFCCCHSSSNRLKRSEVSKSIVCSGTSFSWSLPFCLALCIVGPIKLKRILENTDEPIRLASGPITSDIVSGYVLQLARLFASSAHTATSTAAIYRASAIHISQVLHGMVHLWLDCAEQATNGLRSVRRSPQRRGAR